MDGKVISLNKVVSDYIRRKSIDVFVKDGKRILRSRSGRFATELEPKVIKDNNVLISKEMKNPLVLAGVRDATPVQKLLMNDLINNAFEKYGSLAYQASCGSGKTYCGLLAIYRKRVKTLIISTRSAVIDQWKKTINAIYPDLRIYVGGTKVKKNENINDYDIWVLTPQFLNIGNRILDFEIKPGLIIYDEIHSMLSQLNYTPGASRDKHIAEFANVLKLPFLQAPKWGELPYLLSLSATYPKESIVEIIFGPVRATTKDPITNIPISIFDLRRECDKRGKLDRNWEKPSENDIVRTFAFGLFDQSVRDRALVKDPGVGAYTRAIVAHSQLITPSIKFKGIVMTHSIDSSVWATLFLHKSFNVSVLLLRTSDEFSFFLEKGKNLDFQFSDGVELKDLTIGEKSKDYSSFIEKSEIIVSTYQRVKEGFSIPELVWGICTEFVWNPLTRVQIAGRIRRSSDNEDLNKYPRRLYVCSSGIPNDLYVALKLHREPKITYDQEFEDELFRRENYSYANSDKSSIYFSE